MQVEDLAERDADIDEMEKARREFPEGVPEQSQPTLAEKKLVGVFKMAVPGRSPFDSPPELTHGTTTTPPKDGGSPPTPGLGTALRSAALSAGSMQGSAAGSAALNALKSMTRRKGRFG